MRFLLTLLLIAFLPGIHPPAVFAADPPDNSVQNNSKVKSQEKNIPTPTEDDEGEEPFVSTPEKTAIFVAMEIKEWNTLYEEYYRGKYPPISEKRLTESGTRFYNEIYATNGSGHKIIFAMTLLNYTAMMQGLDDDFIKDAMDYVFRWTQGSEFGVAWYEYQLGVLRDPKGRSPPAYRAQPPLPAVAD